MTLLTNSVFSLMAELATCLCAQISDPENQLPAVCFCGLVPGEAPSLEYTGDCENACGMAWVRLATTYPATGPGQASEQPGNCSSLMNVDIEMGIVRCADVGDDFGNPPSPETLLAETQLQVADMLAMQRAILCCDALDPRDAVVGPYIATSGPDGGLVGGTITVSVVVV